MELSGERFFDRRLLVCDLRCVRLGSEPRILHLQLKGLRFYLYLRHPIGCQERQRYYPSFQV
ncbi:Uncharacterised protein [Vibrio cholerae]|nr:Uncharacterised protein [Vibrio cholerae]CSC16808.1 Uncharacterised protein [Vibrio cholerae]CSC97593.1 Uncharacterised protein [Vibrio cholerae]CSI69329.1 Uncharacterised protein [Vibrio cholerae]